MARKSDYDEIKVTKTYGLTPTGAKLLEEMAGRMGMKPSNLIEKIARGEISLGDYQAGKSSTN